MYNNNSKSLCSALIGQNIQVDHVRRTLNVLSTRLSVNIQWVPGHCGVPGNELADSAAKEASELPGAGTPFPISFHTHRDLIKRTVVDPPPLHQRTREVYRFISLTRDAHLLKSRKDQSDMAKLRTGHVKHFKAYQNRLDGATDPSCPRCGDVPHDLTHWFTQCPATEARRVQLFGQESECLGNLTRRPTESLALARETLGSIGEA